MPGRGLTNPAPRPCAALLLLALGVPWAVAQDQAGEAGAGASEYDDRDEKGSAFEASGAAAGTAAGGLLGVGMGAGEAIEAARGGARGPSTPRERPVKTGKAGPPDANLRRDPPARGSPGTGAPVDGPAAAGSDGPSTAGPNKRSAGRAMKRAGDMAEALRSGLHSGDAGTPGRADPLGGASSAASAGRALDLIPLLASGYAPAVAALGYQVGRGEDGSLKVMKMDGAPATESEVESLRARLASLPGVLVKRPDFFQVIKPEAYERVKALRAQSEASAAFRHVGLSGGRRDLLWTTSCAKVSGDCNPAALEPFYRVNDFVSPETLKNIADWLDGVADEEEEKPLPEPPRGGLRLSHGPPALRSILEALKTAVGMGREEVRVPDKETRGPAREAAPERAPASRRVVEPDAPSPSAKGGPGTGIPISKAALAAFGLSMLVLAVAWGYFRRQT